MAVLAAWTPHDATLDALVPLGLVAATGGGLVIDLDETGPQLGSGPTLAQLVVEGPTAQQLAYEPGRIGYLSNGGVAATEAVSVIGAFAERWPSVVLRCAPRSPRPQGAVAFLTMLPEPFGARAPQPVVYQRSAVGPQRGPDGLVLPVPRRATIEALLTGRRPHPRSRWLRTLKRAWAL